MHFAFHVQGCGLTQRTRKAQTPEDTSDFCRPRCVLALKYMTSQGLWIFLSVLDYNQFPTARLPF